MSFTGLVHRSNDLIEAKYGVLTRLIAIVAAFIAFTAEMAFLSLCGEFVPAASGSQVNPR